MKTRNELHWVAFVKGLWMLSDGKQFHCPVRAMPEGESWIDYFLCEHDKSMWHKLEDAKANCETYMVG